MDELANESVAGAVNDTPAGACSEDAPVFCLARTVSVSVVLGAITGVTVVGNIFVLAAYAGDRRISSAVANAFILSLSVSDLIVGAVSLPLNTVWVVLDRWPFGKLPCQLWLVLDYTSTNVAVITILFISLDRYWLLTKKLAYGAYQTHRRAAAMITASWAVTGLFYTLVTFAWSPLTGVDNVDYSEDCELEPYDNLPFLAFEVAVEFFIPLLIIAVLNARVYVNIKRRSKGIFRTPGGYSHEVSGVSLSIHDQSRSRQGRSLDRRRLPVELRHSAAREGREPGADTGQSNAAFDGGLEGIALHLVSDGGPTPAPAPAPAPTGGGDPARRAREPRAVLPAAGRDHGATRREFRRHRKAAVTLSVLVGVFVAFWLPFYVASLVAAFCRGCVSDLAWEVANYLLWCNSTVNPFLYALLAVRFRQNFLRFLGLRSCAGQS